MVLQQSFEVLFSVLGEQESVDLGTEFLECEVGGCEEGAAGVRRVFDGGKEASFLEAELQGAEFSG